MLKRPLFLLQEHNILLTAVPDSWIDRELVDQISLVIRVADQGTVVGKNFSLRESIIKLGRVWPVQHY